MVYVWIDKFFSEITILFDILVLSLVVVMLNFYIDQKIVNSLIYISAIQLI